MLAFLILCNFDKKCTKYTSKCVAFGNQRNYPDRARKRNEKMQGIFQYESYNRRIEKWQEEKL